MNAADSLAWGELLTAQGNGNQLQYNSCCTGWQDDHLESDHLRITVPGNWRRKPKTRTLTVWTWKSQEGFYHSRNSDECTAPMLNTEVFDTHTIEVEA